MCKCQSGTQRVPSCVNATVVHVMYKSFILPLFDYADVIWNNCTNTLADELEHLHLDAIRTTGVRGISHQKLLTETGLMSLSERRQCHKLILYFKIVNGITSSYLGAELPQLVSAVNPYHRHSCCPPPCPDT